MRNFRLLLLGGLAAVTLGLSLLPSNGQSLSHRIAGLSITENVSAQQPPAIASDRARAIATLKLSEFSSNLHGLVVTSSYHSGAFLSAADSSGRLTVNFTAPTDAWVIQFKGPSQDNWANVRAVVIVNAQSGEIESASLAKWN